MAKSKKFGTFGGVFTPSILTILGVIMYLRLPWIAGQAGLYMTIGIVLLAHLISVTTGLSVSSIATDKKVKAGGTYYMISRSLGLPIGGTLGLALFVGLSFSVSLYLIGFSESFLGYWGYSLDTDTIRLTGTIILVAVTVITFISTSLAIKTQYIIMTAIGLSLISILFGNHDFTPTAPLLSPTATAAPFIVLFGIFFPAVTGFEAGVSMSGDLRDPKKSIPMGTISAIVIGLVVYIFLAYFFSTSVSADLLENDPKALLKISWIPELVIAGIWGATLSSALGSILGAPRILQATAVDKITPKFFGKGVGETNEPRNALLLTFIIAEAGILIGDLDVIARIVSMFFITTYGFLNLSCAIERWASSDFHPDFKVPGIVSLIGSAACFIVMIQLDFVAMLGATIILGALFIYLKRKELTLETGDTWEGIWASLVRTGLTKLKGRIRAVRNWRPNIILFSGGIQARPHLVEFGKAITGRLGVISNFDLVEDPNSEMLFSNVSSSDDEEIDLPESGIFSKRLTCKNIFQGIEAITRVYGFTGIEPNTVLMGWARNVNYADNFAKLITDLNRLDYNVIFLDYDKEKGFGEYKTIDIWWKGHGNNFSFALTILRFIKSNQSWKDADLRVLFIIDDGANPEHIYKNAQQVLDQYRIDAEIKIINNGIERKSPTEIIQSESSQSDLTILGISEESTITPKAYIEKMNSFMDNFGSVILIHSSSFFEGIDVGISKKVETEKEISALKADPLPSLPIARNNVIASNWEKLDQEVSIITNSFCVNSIYQVSEKHKELNIALQKVAESQFEGMLRVIGETDKPRFTRLLNKSLNDLLFQINRIAYDYRFDLDESFENIFKDSTGYFKTSISDLLDRMPKKLVVHFYEDDLKPSDNEKIFAKFFKLRKRIKAKLTKKPASIEVDFQHLLKFYLKHQIEISASEVLNQYGLETIQFFSEIKLLINALSESLDRLLNLNSKNKLSSSLIEEERNNIFSRFEKIETNLSSLDKILKNKMLIDWRKNLIEMNELTQKPTVNFEIKRKNKIIKSTRAEAGYIDDFVYIWNKNYKYLSESFTLTTNSLWLKGRLKVIKSDIEQSISTFLKEDFYNEINRLKEDSAKTTKGKIKSFDYTVSVDPGSVLSKQLEEHFESARKLYSDLPEKVEIPSQDLFIAAENQKFLEGEPSVVQYRRLAEHLFETNFIESIQANIINAAEKLIDVRDSLKDAVNLTNFTIGTLDDDVTDDGQKLKVLEGALKEFERKINKEKQLVLDVENELCTKVEKDFKLTVEPLNSYSILKASTELGQLIRQTEGKKVLSGVSNLSEQISKTFQDIIVNLIYGKSKSRLFARRQKNYLEKDISVIDSVLRLVNSISPNPTAYALIPYYYKKLFNGTSRVSSDFQVGMKNELAKAAYAIQNYKSGYRGALLILGERNSGKTTLSRMIVSKYFKADRVYTIQSPKSNSANVETFEQMLKKSTDSRGSIEEVFSALPQGSVVVINDLELWWERSEKGFEVIDVITNLIQNFSNKILFIVNCNIHSFKLMNTINKMDGLFISTIECRPFDSESLKDVILLRHDSSGIKFKLGDKMDEELGEIKLAGLFDDYFNYSNGNVGVALNAWIANITKVDSNTVTIKHPTVPDISALQNIDDDWLIYISQIMLHRRVSIGTLRRLMKVSDEKCAEVIKTLLRAGIILEKSAEIYGINFFLEPYLTRLLKERKVIL